MNLAKAKLLLLKHYFGAQKQGLCLQALNICFKKYYDAWRTGQDFILITFNMKGVYNAIKSKISAKRLEKSNILEIIVKLVEDFCKKRQVYNCFGKSSSKILSLETVELSQELPLLPISSIFDNAALVNFFFTNEKRELDFVDDYSTGIIRNSAQNDLK